MNILVAEDDPQIARLVEFKLAREGYQVTLARNGQEALSMLGQVHWSLIILDIMMPILNGWEVLSAIRSSALSLTPVLILTAKGYQKKDLVNASDLGATHFLRKPFDPVELALQVKKLVAAP